MYSNTLTSNSNSAANTDIRVNAYISNIDRLIRIDEVMKISGLKRSSLYAKVAHGKFPSPVKIGDRSSAWRLSEINQWIEQL